ncbi:GrpB family protein [Maridesulfovibrio zosterae]|uniref:GrpB family protein n=1 Tax=Maridesulfovibrio zosterae TaxID=82171 RepID=UPI00040D6D84|nr:GrpB family protein [Maridesulfovibrio zosterae]
MINETLHEKIKRVTAESVEIEAYNPCWVNLFEHEKQHIYECMPEDLIIRIEHFGSTAVPGLAAKSIVDMVIEIYDEELGRIIIPKVLEPQGYDCFWRPLGNENVPPYFTWCIKRDGRGSRTHHLHFVKAGFKNNELRFRDILRSNQAIAAEYGALKIRLSQEYSKDRIKYTQAKGDFICGVLNAENK